MPAEDVLTVDCCSRCGGTVPENGIGGASEAVYCSPCRQFVMELTQGVLEDSGGPPGAPGEDFHDYEILRELGTGGMGAVYLARHRGNGEEAALKVMLPHVVADEQAAARFFREAALTRALSHPHAIAVRGCVHGRAAFVLVMEYCAGGSMASLVRRRGGRLPWAEAVPLMLQALDGLAHAHTAPLAVTLPDGSHVEARGVVHRDLKPANLLLAGPEGSWTVKVADFGLAKAFDLAGLSRQTLSGARAGTPPFMSRQQVIQFKYAKPEVDVWAAAACLYYLMTGHTPRDYPRGRNPWEITLETERVPVRQRPHGGEVPPRLADLLDEALIDHPAIPYTSAATFAAAVRKAVA